MAEAEALRAEQLSKTNLGSQQALLQVYSEMVQKSNEGVEKIVYCDPTLQAGGGSAFALPALQNLNRDLHALQARAAVGGPVPPPDRLLPEGIFGVDCCVDPRSSRRRRTSTSS